MEGHQIIQEKMRAHIKAPEGLQLQIPPPAFLELHGEFVAYEPRRSLICRFPVQEKHLNPAGRLQGGFLAAAVDNTMGPLSYLAAGRATTTLDLHLNYLRGAYPGETIEVKATIIGRGFDTMLISAETFDARKRLIATATSQLYILRTPSGASAG
ncbi:MAG: PaaI family thioesterase [Leptospirales bacterium]|nr:PaaI family thioesterase [Leptospirales bacterium]